MCRRTIPCVEATAVVQRGDLVRLDELLEANPWLATAHSNDVVVLDALLDAGADIEAPGAVLGGRTALADARGFGNLAAARRLVERGARTRLEDAAALGMLDRLEEALAGPTPPSPEEVTHALWSAC